MGEVPGTCPGSLVSMTGSIVSPNAMNTLEVMVPVESLFLIPIEDTSFMDCIHECVVAFLEY